MLIPMWISQLAVVIRRLHDMGRGRAWIVLVPLIGGLRLLLLTTEPAQPQTNWFG